MSAATPTRTRGPRLRTSLSAVTVVITMLALLVSVALVLLTTLLYRTTADVGAAMQSVRFAQEAEIDLLLHERTQDGLVKRDAEGKLFRKLAQIKPYLTSEEETRALKEASARLEAYTRSSREPGLPAAESGVQREAAYSALESFITINMLESKAAQKRAERWSHIGHGLGIGIGALFLVAAAGLLVWLKRRAFQPLFSLAAAMQRFGRGDRSARAEETGPAELREMSRRFNEMASALAAQRQAQMAFLGGVAHDLRNPLLAVKMSMAMVRPDEPLPSELRLRRAIGMVNRQVIRLERMVGDLLDMAMIEAGQLELQLQPEDARALVGEVVSLFEGMSPRHRLEVSLPDDEVEIRCDGLRIEQVLTNLVSNAIKYSPAGGPVEIVVERRGDEVSLRVTDRGLGISEEDQRRLFEPFHRTGESSAVLPGLGLGLFVAQRIVAAHGGHITVESAPGRGSTFTVLLPSLASNDATS